MTQNIIYNGMNIFRRYKIAAVQPCIYLSTFIKSYRCPRTGTKQDLISQRRIVIFGLPCRHYQLNKIFLQTFTNVH